MDASLIRRVHKPQTLQARRTSQRPAAWLARALLLFQLITFSMAKRKGFIRRETILIRRVFMPNQNLKASGGPSLLTLERSLCEADSFSVPAGRNFLRRISLRAPRARPLKLFATLTEPPTNLHPPL